MPTPRKRLAATATGGATWRRATGQKLVGLTLSADEGLQLRAVAGGLGLSAAEFSRRLVRWALAPWSEDDPRGRKKIEEIVK